MDIFQLAQSGTYVGSYSNWAYIIMALRLSASLDPSDPSDPYHRSVILMNGNPRVPADPFKATKLDLQGGAARAPTAQWGGCVLRKLGPWCLGRNPPWQERAPCSPPEVRPPPP